MELVVATVAGKAITLPLALWLEHFAVLGKTGFGKSVFCRLLLSQLIRLGEGLTLIDPDNDTADAVIADMAEMRRELSPFRRRQVHVIEFGDKYGIRLDPFTVATTPRLLTVVATQIMEVMARAHVFQSYDEMRRLKRVLKVVLYLCGTRVYGKYAGLQTAFDWLEFGTTRWKAAYRKVRSHLPKLVAREADHLASLPPSIIEREVESTRNLLESTLGDDLILQLVSPGPSVDFRVLVRNRNVAIWNLGLEELTRDQRNVLAALAFVGTHWACYHERVRHWTLVEEAASVLAHDFGSLLRQARKRQQILGLFNQDISSFREERTDQRSVVISQPGIHFCFHTKGPMDELDELAHLFAIRSLDLRLNYKPTDRPNGYGIITLAEASGSHGRRTGTRVTKTGTRERARKRENRRGVEQGVEKGQAEEKSHSLEDTERRDEGEFLETQSTNGRKLEYDATPFERDSRIRVTMQREERQGRRRQAGRGSASSARTGRSLRTSRAVRRSETHQTLSGFLDSVGEAIARSREVDESWSESITGRNHLIPRHREEWYPSGLIVPLEAQYAEWKRILSQLDVGEMVVMAKNLPAVVSKVPFLGSPFAGLERAREYLVGEFKKWIRSIHPYYFDVREPEKCPDLPDYKSRKGTKNS